MKAVVVPELFEVVPEIDSTMPMKPNLTFEMYDMLAYLFFFKIICFAWIFVQSLSTTCTYLSKLYNKHIWYDDHYVRNIEVTILHAYEKGRQLYNQP